MKKNEFKTISFVLIMLVLVITFLLYRESNLNKIKDQENSVNVCTSDYAPVCGTDGRTYSNSCVAEKENNTKVDYKGMCKDNEIMESNSGTQTDILKDKETSSGTEIIQEEQKMDQKMIDYYTTLETECVNEECCLASLDNMKQVNAKLAENDICPVGYKLEMLECEDTYKWCELSNSELFDSSGSLLATGTISGEKVTNYFNPPFSYGFSMPINSYYSGFGSQNGSSHSVGINSGTGIENFADASVKVYFYKNKIVDELKDSSYGMYEDEQNGKVYIKLDNNSLVIEASDIKNKIVDTIIKTVYVK